MRLGFFFQGTDQSHIAMAKMMIASVREVMPGVEVHHLTDEHTAEIDGVDSTRVFYGEMPMAVRRMLHHAACEGEWLFVDSDVLIRRDVRDVFDKPFDVALTDRDGTVTNEAKFAAQMPYNIGVTFSRSQKFWYAVVQHLSGLTPQQQHWMGDQLVVNAMVKAGGMGFTIATVPGRIYNYPPRSEEDIPEDAAIIHYKGPRKKYLLKEAA